MFSVQFHSVTQLCPTLWDPMDCSMPGFPVHYQLLELAQTHIHTTISSSVVPFSSCLQSFPASGFFCMEPSKCFLCMALRIKLKVSLGQQSPAWSDTCPSAKARLFLTPDWHPILLTSFFLCANYNLLRSCFLILCTYCPLSLDLSSPRSHRAETSSFRLLVT